MRTDGSHARIKEKNGGLQMEDYNALYHLWMEQCKDPALKKELEEIQNDEDAILDFLTRNALLVCILFGKCIPEGS